MEKGSVRKKRANEKRTVSLEFLASISHEIRNPVNIIIGLIHLMKSAETEEEKIKYAEELESTSRGLLDLVNNIMDFSKVDADKLNYEYKFADLRESIVENSTGLKTLAEAKGIDLIIEISDHLPRYVYTDPVKINQVNLNLLSNALKFTQQGQVRLLVEVEEVREDKTKVKFTVRDTGPGIPKEKLKTIFNAFDQGSDLINLKFGGTGLGLSICKKVVSTLGGNLQVLSEVGKGTSFTFSLDLPTSEEPSEPEIKALVKALDISGKRGTVLVVDDSEINTLLISKTLERENFQVLVAHNGLTAIKILQEQMVDIILLDIHMPEMDGIEAAGIIKKFPGLERVPIIAVTGSMEISSLDTLQAFGFSDFILKPFHPEELARKTISLLCGSEV